MEETGIKKRINLVVLTGAGISAESGIKTFRDAGGLWEGHKLEEVATPEAFERDPLKVHRFYNQRRAQLLSDKVSPNKGHFDLASLAKYDFIDSLIVTQNVDDLHERAGEGHVLHMHGELLKIRCLKCHQVQYWQDDLELSTPCSSCHKKGGLRPDIVWFGEMPKYMDKIEDALLSCSHFASIGTSSQVYPAAGFIQLINSLNPSCQTFELNPHPTPLSDHFDHVIAKNATVAVEEFIQNHLLP